MKRRIENIFMLVIGILIGSGIVYGANLYKSEDIVYNSTDSSWEVENVSDAINSLYSMKQELDNIKSIGDATASDILLGKTALVKGKEIVGVGKGSEVVLVANIGTVTANASSAPSYTYDIKQLVDNYAKLTNNNFFITVSGAYGNTNHNTWSDASIYISKSYNASTGTLKISTSFSRANSGGYQAALYGVTVYMVS